MSTCKQHQESYVDYVFNLLSDLQIAGLEAHLENCDDCRQHVRAWKEVLRLSDGAEEIVAETASVEDIAIKVYKRLAAEPRKKTQRNFSSRIADRLLLSVSNLSTPPIRMFPINVSTHWRGALAVCVLVLGLISSAVFFNGKQSATAPLASVKVLPASKRIEQYRSQGIRRSLEDVLVIKHLRNDDREAASRLRILNEQVEGTRYEHIANQQLQMNQISFR